MTVHSQPIRPPVQTNSTDASAALAQGVNASTMVIVVAENLYPVVNRSRPPQ